MTGSVVPLRLSCWAPEGLSVLPDFHHPDPPTEVDGVEEQSSTVWGQGVFPNTVKEGKEKTLKSAPKKRGSHTHSPIFPLFILRHKRLDTFHLTQDEEARN